MSNRQEQTIWIQEEYVDATENCRFGESEVLDTGKPIGKIRKFLRH